MDDKLPDLKPKVVLGIVAHPDDLDFSSSGSFAKWGADGAETHYLIVTNGSKGSDDPAMTSDQLIKIRRDEQRAAAKILGVKSVTFFDYEDGELEVTKELKKDIAREIRRVKPDTVVTLDPTFVYAPGTGIINHSDHRAAGQAAIDAVYPLARDRLTYPELIEEGFEPHKVKHLLLTSFTGGNFFVDISDSFDKKVAALKEHKSQISDFSGVENRMRHFAHESGKKFGCELAESFNRVDMFI